MNCEHKCFSLVGIELFGNDMCASLAWCPDCGALYRPSLKEWVKPAINRSVENVPSPSLPKEPT